MKGIDSQVLWDTLNANQTFIGYGLRGEAPIPDGEKCKIKALISKDLVFIHADNGDEFFAELWTILRQSLATCNWFARDYKTGKINHVGVWKVMRLKALRMAKTKALTSKPRLVSEYIKKSLEAV